jgi:hypothetical protein
MAHQEWYLFPDKKYVLHCHVKAVYRLMCQDALPSCIAPISTGKF